MNTFTSSARSRNALSIAIAGVVFFTLNGLPGSLSASELMSSADAFDTGAWQLSVYGQHVEEEPVIEVSGIGAIQVPTSGGGTTIFSKANADIEMESEYDAVLAALTFRPRDGLHYRIKVGQIRDYQLEFSSGSLVNSFRSQKDGFLWGVGARWNASQATIVSAAFAIDVSYTQRILDFDRFQSGSTISSANHRLEQDEYQAALNMSRRWNWVEPYAGLKISRLVTRLKDKSVRQQVRGDVDQVSPFVGVGLSVFNGEKIFIEASFVDEESINAGLNIRFDSLRKG